MIRMPIVLTCDHCGVSQNHDAELVPGLQVRIRIDYPPGWTLAMAPQARRQQLICPEAMVCGVGGGRARPW